MANDYILGIDYGEQRVGLALAHNVARLPRPLKTVQNDAQLLPAIAQVVKDESVGRIVVGLPRNMDGSLGFQAKAVTQFVTLLSDEVPLPVSLVDETLSSVEASAYGPAAVQQAGLDAVAAAVILDRYLASTEQERG